MNTKFAIVLVLVFSFFSNAQKILFDATKSQMAGNADWVIDADSHNIFTSSGPSQSGGGTESNPQRYPTPAQSGITSTTSETFWNGALSYWAIDCVKQGYTVETLPYNGQITYGVTSNLQDLSNYKVFVVDEPNISFTASEMTAIINFVSNGGGLMMIADHTISDRNNDGIDSLVIWNDLMSSNSVLANPFGITFDTADFSQTSTNVAALPTNPILHGSFGNVTKAQWSGGTTMTLNTTANASVKGLIFKTGSSTTGLSNVMCASATYGNGKVVAIGDSSIPDDGTGDSNDILYDGYITDAAGNHQKLLMNAIIWLATTTLGTENFEDYKSNFVIVPNPVEGKILKGHFTSATVSKSMVVIFDSLGRAVKQLELDASTNNSFEIDCANLNSGIYFAKVVSESNTKTIKFIIK